MACTQLHAPKMTVSIGNGMGLQNPRGSRVQVAMGTGAGMDFPTRELQNEPKIIQNGSLLSVL